MYTLLILIPLLCASTVFGSSRAYLTALNAIKTKQFAQFVRQFGSVHDERKRSQLITTVLEEYGNTLSEHERKQLERLLDYFSTNTRILLRKKIARHVAQYQAPFGKDILLIINFNFMHYQNIPLLKELYEKDFPNMVFYGPVKHSAVERCDHYRGWYSYKVIAQAMEKYPNYRGYLYVHDDCIMNVWNYSRFDFNKLWITAPDLWTPLKGASTPANWWGWWDMPQGRAAVRNVYGQLPSINKSYLINNIGEGQAIAGHADIAYVPQAYREQFIQLSAICTHAELFLEIALPTIIFSLADKAEIQFFKGEAFRGPVRGERKILNAYRSDLDFLHPVKMSDRALWASIQSKMCEGV